LAKALTSIASRLTLTPCRVNMQQGDPNGNHGCLWLGRVSTGGDATRYRLERRCNDGGYDLWRVGT